MNEDPLIQGIAQRQGSGALVAAEGMSQVAAMSKSPIYIHYGTATEIESRTATAAISACPHRGGQKGASSPMISAIPKKK